MKGLWKTGLSDHKLLYCELMVNFGVPPTTQTRSSYCSIKRKWDLSLLRIERVRQNYQQELTTKLASYTPTNNNTADWTEISLAVTTAADKTLRFSKRKMPESPETKKVSQAFKRARFELSENPNAENRQKLKAARQAVTTRVHLNNVREHQEFFQNLNDYHVTDRIRKTYSFVRLSRKAPSLSDTFIPLSHWEHELSATEGPFMDYIEDDFCPLLRPPSAEEVLEVIQDLKRGKAPGEDSISADLIQFGVDELVTAITSIIQRAWIENDIPEAWITSLQFPLPKVKHPVSINDYRKISLTSTGYKIYIIILYRRIEEYLTPILPYQSGFVRGRSTSDQLYVMRRILEERWNEGYRAFVLSLDLRKAFDSVSLQSIPTILRNRGVPAQLVNRLINAALKSKTSLVWFNQKTRYFAKNRGVKQGCPVSPILFNLVIDEAVTKLQIQLRERASPIRLELFRDRRTELRLPCILAYADDLIVIAPTVEKLEIVFEGLTQNLSSFDLSLNESKTKLLVRDPEHRFHPPTYHLAGFQIDRVETLKCLGSPITSTIDRPMQIKVRKYSALGVYRNLLSYFRPMKMPFPLLRMVYTTVILPVLTYGLNVMSLIKINRESIARKEALMIQGFADIAHPRVRGQTPKQLLDGKTANRIVSAYRLRYHGHILRRSHRSHLYRSMIQTVDKRKVGRPAKTWNDSLREDREAYQYSSAEWEAASHDKELYKRMTEETYDPELPEEFDRILNLERSHIDFPTN